MFFFKNARRCCFYTKIYENIRIVKKVKLEGRASRPDGGGSSKYPPTEPEQSCAPGKEQTKESSPSLKDIKTDKSKQFYKNVYEKIKQKNVKLGYHGERLSDDFIDRGEAGGGAPLEEGLREASGKEVPMKRHPGFSENRSEEKVGVSDKLHERRDTTWKEKVAERLNLQRDIQSGKGKVIKGEEYLKIKNNYLKSKDVYLKVKDGHVSGYSKVGRDRQGEGSPAKWSAVLAKAPLQSRGSKFKGEKKDGGQEEKMPHQDREGDSLDGMSNRTEEGVETKGADKNERERGSLKCKSSLSPNGNHTNKQLSYLRYNDKNKLMRDSPNGKDNKENIPFDPKLEKVKNAKGECQVDAEAADKNYVDVEYEQYWDSEKIKKVLQLQKNREKIFKNKLFKGVLCVSPYDTSKCIVISEEEPFGSLKKDIFNIHGYINRNRALNDDVVYAYTARRKIKRSGDLENEEEILEASQESTISGSEKDEEKTEHFCRVVNIVERKNCPIVCTLNYLNINKSINNTFGRKGAPQLKSENLLSNPQNVKTHKREGSNMVCDPNHEELPPRKKAKKGQGENALLCAKVQPVDPRLPCFIYDGSSCILNRLVHYLKKKKINLYLLVKFKKWDTHQMNPYGSITTILGNEKNFLGVIYFFIHFYKIHFHIYERSDMSYLKSKMGVSDKVLVALANRQSSASRAQGEESYGRGEVSLGGVVHRGREPPPILQHQLKMSYLKNMQENNKRIEKYMLKSFLKNREIITNLDIFTIDPPTAKDLDDALSIEFVDSDTNASREFEYRIGVHISDVSFFVTPDSYYDRVASKMCNTIYMDLMVIHMLPSILSEEICSLNTQGEKLSFSVFFRLSSRANPYDFVKGEIGESDENAKSDNIPMNEKDVEIMKSLIKSKKKLNYDTVEDFLDEVYGNLQQSNNNIKEKEQDILVRGNLPLSSFPFVANFEAMCKKYDLSIKLGSDIFRLFLLSKMLKERSGRKSVNSKPSLLFLFNEEDTYGSCARDRGMPIQVEELEECYSEGGNTLSGNLSNHLDDDALNKGLEAFLKKKKVQSLLEEMDMENIRVEKIDYRAKSHMLIEEMMILTNFLVANKISQSKKMGILRIHENTSEEIKNNLLHIIDHKTYILIDSMINIKSSNINDILNVCEKVLGSNQLMCMQYNILKHYKEAIYIPYTEGEKKTHHFGLALNKYIHFTSPIRRYIDIIIHRILGNIVEGDEEGLNYSYEDLKKICDQCNVQKKKTDEAQIHLKNVLLNRYLVYLNEAYKTEKSLVANVPKSAAKDGDNHSLKDSSLCVLHQEERRTTPHDNTVQCITPLEGMKPSVDQPQRKERDGLTHKGNELDEYQEPIKKYFYRRNGLIYFPTEAYIQEIVITKNVKESICLNILFENYIDVDGMDDTEEDYTSKTYTYTSYMLSSCKGSNPMSSYPVEKSNSITDRLKLINEANDEIPTANHIREESAKCKLKKNAIENSKLKNAVVFYVPLLETEKSISDTLLNLTFQFISVSYEESTFVYDLSRRVLYRVGGNATAINGPLISGDLDGTAKEEESTPSSEHGMQNIATLDILNILKKINNPQFSVKYEVLKLDEKKAFEKIYDFLYIHDIFFKRVEEGTSRGNCSRGINHESFSTDEHNKGDVGLMEKPAHFDGEKSERNKASNGDARRECAEEGYTDEYERISRFQKKEILIVPGSQVWTLRLA
ncbi:exoribonuclease II, putative [Plasmodium knowlesi strain H]|uniref:Exoribonuclease II, putative n=3 Tax=Plasmodium knowlesi TaxID=5850 RepID=A0A5K1VTR1_PLAKH|nr:exoribonuclease II, putative [Plasmodium knowlesi strain H]OTN67298.1 putative Exoribonuclease II [Plasmodium knowlesi]CAA9987328.1 exoribonuclease II, putative [Plasmodium knowlesi strain H]SBO23391.1 exoribonuclease II, putative [Plasmodium knowlesi strain H]SBO24635.1 exoribonuclease II, putative [Plasmodium knowlesi strain H]VVS76802.1 exoribonuclease II, putative [Plasmodium knowlesi strain H]|eukprot:XP_002258332.1 ribonuclease II family protein, putative [Plasmodium knowlesi strain H]